MVKNHEARAGCALIDRPDVAFHLLSLIRPQRPQKPADPTSTGRNTVKIYTIAPFAASK
jgi:hypothetical protein